MAGNSPIKSLSVIAGFWGGEFAKDDSWLWARLVDGEYIERDIKFNYGLSVRGIKSN
jgi:hypothetical protein